MCWSIRWLREPQPPMGEPQPPVRELPVLARGISSFRRNWKLPDKTQQTRSRKFLSEASSSGRFRHSPARHFDRQGDIPWIICRDAPKTGASLHYCNFIHFETCRGGTSLQGVIPNFNGILRRWLRMTGALLREISRGLTRLPIVLAGLDRP